MKKLITALLLSVSSVVSAQNIDLTTGTVQTTPNVIDPTLWTPIIPMTGSQLDQVEGSGGGPTPALNTDTNTIRFSYSTYTVSQINAINSVLSSQGIKISGYNYSWKIYNDLSNCCSTRGTLTGQVAIGNSSGAILENYYYDYSNVNTGPNFQLFTGTQNFSKQYGLNEAEYIGVAFTGKDQNFWSGYYGPRVRNVNLTLNYTVATTPIPTDFSRWIPLSNENDTFTLTTSGVVRYGANDTYIYRSLEPGTYSCSNGAWGNDPIGGVYKQCSLGSNTTTPTILPTPNKTATIDYSVTGSDPVAGPTTTTALASNTSEPSFTTGAPPPPPGSEPPPGSPPPTNNSSPAQPASTGSPQSAPSGSPQSNSGPAPSISPQSNASPTNVASAGPATQQGGPQQSGSPSSGPSLSSVLTTIKNNEKKEQAIAQAAVSGANEVAQTAVSATEQTALSVAAMSVTSSQTSSAYNSSSSSNNNDASNSSKSSLAMGMPLVTTNTQTGPLQGSSNVVANITSMQGSVVVNQSTQQVATINTQTLQLSQQIQQTQNSQLQLRGPETSEIKTVDNNTLFSNNFLTNRSNPITEIVENNTKTNTSERNEQISTTVKTNVQSNDLAGKVDIASIAVVPVGYNLYTGLILKDVAFYAPKEIYRNQKNVDNTRLLRQLASDAKHEQMVNLQYGEK